MEERRENVRNAGKPVKTAGKGRGYNFHICDIFPRDASKIDRLLKSKMQDFLRYYEM